MWALCYLNLVSGHDCNLNLINWESPTTMMKRDTRHCFIPSNYGSKVYKRLHGLTQDSHTLKEYYNELEMLLIGHEHERVVKKTCRHSYMGWMIRYLILGRCFLTICCMMLYVDLCKGRKRTCVMFRHGHSKTFPLLHGSNHTLQSW